jgi:hypothetical protein
LVELSKVRKKTLMKHVYFLPQRHKEHKEIFDLLYKCLLQGDKGMMRITLVSINICLPQRNKGHKEIQNLVKNFEIFINKGFLTFFI